MNKFLKLILILIITISILLSISCNSVTSKISNESELESEVTVNQNLEPKETIQTIKAKPEINPIIIANVDTPGWAYGLYLEENYVYIADINKGLQIIDISNKAQPFIVGSAETPVEGDGMSGIGAYDVFVKDNYAYVANGKAGLIILDVSDKSKPFKVGLVETSDLVASVFVKDSYAYIANGNSGFLIVDITDKKNPITLSNIDTPGGKEITGGALGVYVKDNYAYIADGDKGLQIIDISDKKNPFIIGSVDTPGNNEPPGGANRVFVDGNYSYIADQFSGLQIIDISDKKNPFIIGSVDTPTWASDVYVKDNYAYIADGDSGLLIIDITDKKNPIINKSIDRFSMNFEVADNYAYISSGDGGLVMVNLFSPQIDSSPIEDDGIMVPYIESLRYDKETNTYYALKDNPYGLEEDAEAGVFIKEAIMIDDKVESGIGLVPQVISALQNFYKLNKKELKFPLPFDLVRAEGVIINLLESQKEVEEKYRWDTFTNLEVYAPERTVVYSPLVASPNDKYNGCRISYSEGSSDIDTSIVLQSAEGLFYKGEGIHSGALSINSSNAELLTDISGYNDESSDEESYSYRVNSEIGMPLIKVRDSILTAEKYEPNIEIYYRIGQYSFNEEEQRYETVKYLETGKAIFLEISGTKIFILPEDKFPSSEEVENRNSEQIPVFGKKDISEFSGLKIKGLDVVYKNGKWTYVDTANNSTVGYWDDTEGKIIIMSKVLKGEWAELFIGKTPEEIETYFDKSGEIEWNYENWSNGKIKLPLPLEINSDLLIENESIFIFFKGLPKGAESDAYCPINDVDSSIFPQDYTGKNGGFALLKDDIKIDFYCSNKDDIITSKKETKNFKVGYPLLKIDGNDVFEEYEWLKKLESIIKGSQFFMSVMVQIPDDGNTYNYDFTFNNLLQDEMGRIIFIKPLNN